MARRSKHLSPAVRRDSLIMIQANEEDATKLQGVLDLYECSGQIINKDKSTIMFSKNIGSEHKVAVMRTMRINRESFSDKYLGLPIHVGSTKAQLLAS